MPASGKPAEQNGAGKYVAIIVFLWYHPISDELFHGRLVGNMYSELTRSARSDKTRSCGSYGGQTDRCRQERYLKPERGDPTVALFCIALTRP